MKRIAKTSKKDTKQSKKLVISQERVRSLTGVDEAQLAQVAGGVPCVGSRPTC